VGEKNVDAIAVKGLSVRYHKDSVFEDIDFQIAQGEFFSLVGGNGVGKSTLIKTILNFVDAAKGSIHLFGQSHTLAQSRESVAYLPEKFIASYFLTGYEFLNYLLSLYGTKACAEQMNAMAAALDLKQSFLNRSVGEYSKGMTQKLGLAACFLSEKSLIILDEPMSGLDPKARVLVKRQLNLLKEKGRTVLFCSHVLPDVGELSDRLAVLNDGKLSFLGTVDELLQKFETKDIEAAFIQCIGASQLVA